jgi:hypothetical protein
MNLHDLMRSTCAPRKSPAPAQRGRFNAPNVSEIREDAVGLSGRDSPWSCTLDDVARELGVSREQARMIEQRALKKCRAFCKKRALRMEDLLGI